MREMSNRRPERLPGVRQGRASLPAGADELLRLQRTAGNRAVSALIAGPADRRSLHRRAMGAPVEHEGLLEDTNTRRTADEANRPSAMTYHHIISRNMLWEFWDKVVTNREQAYLSHMVSAIIDRGYASLLGGRAKEDSNGQPIERDDVETTMGGVLEGQALVTQAEKDAFALFTRMYQWMPGNIMHGPDSSLRTDDAKSGFEEASLFIVGKPHFTLLKTTYDEMERYRAMAEGAERRRLLISVAKRYIQISGKKDIFRFDQTQWDHNPKRKTWSVRKAA